MTGRDRMVAIGLAVVAVLGAVWILLVSPERNKANSLSSQVTTAQGQLSGAEGQLSSARSAESQYASAYAAIVSLGKAVPANDEVPSLIYQISQVSHHKNVEFASITSGASADHSSSSPTAPAVAEASFAAMPFTFVFNGTYFDLEHLFEQLNRFTVRNASGALQVSGRLLTVQSVHLAPLSAGVAQGKGPVKLTGSITASAYVLPVSQGLTAGATASSPAGTTATSSAAGSSSPTTPAIARVTP
jgi:Tfp pilus assembly protein PilO